MLEEPAIDSLALCSTLHDAYNLTVTDLRFLPLGADLNTAVYRVATKDTHDYFLKLRSGTFNEAAVAIPRYLRDTGMIQIIPPLRAASGQLWTRLPPYNVILYPYEAGHNAFEQKLTEGQWIEFGSALKHLHAAAIPPDLTRHTPPEDFSPRWRDSVRSYLARFEREVFDEPVAAQLAAFLKSKTAEVLKMVDRAELLAGELKGQPLRHVLCHGGIHGWNLLVGDNGSLYIVDWDTLIFAPVERDLMFIGAGLGDSGRTAEEEETLFYRGYGPVNVNRPAIAYYRYERIIGDIAAYCDEVFLSKTSSTDRQQALENVMSNFRSGGTVERAQEADAMPE